MGTLNGLIQKGLLEEGYIEKATNADLDSKTKNKGNKNYTKYSRDLNALGLMGCQAQPWCCTFQFWLEIQEFGLEQALKNWNMTKKNYVGYHCFSTYRAFMNAGKTGKEPKLGAVVIFNFSHAGRVVKIFKENGKNYFDCLEGNTSSNLSDRNGGQVKIKTRPFNDSTVKGFCYIDYENFKEYQQGFVPAADGQRWWYHYRDGSYPSNCWAYLTEQTTGSSGWYLFDSEGYMLTGYQTAPDGKKYFLCPNGIHQGQCMVTNNKGELMIAEYDTAANQYLLKEI